MGGQAAYGKVSERLLRSRFVGGCPRDFTGCPEDWEMVGNSCQPSATYGGSCQSLDPSITSEEKEALAIECRLSWPCEATCARDFSGCPQGWQGSADSCVAPSSYQGICSTTTRFSGYSTRQKAEWAALCNTNWPCAGALRAATAPSVSFLAARSMPIDADKIRSGIPLTEALKTPPSASVNLIMREDLGSMRQASKYQGMQDQVRRLQEDIEEMVSDMSKR